MTDFLTLNGGVTVFAFFFCMVLGFNDAVRHNGRTSDGEMNNWKMRDAIRGANDTGGRAREKVPAQKINRASLRRKTLP
jgi:hypothetical protein